MTDRETTDAARAAEDKALAAERAGEDAEDGQQNAALKAALDELVAFKAQDATEDAAYQARIRDLEAQVTPNQPKVTTLMGASVNGPLGGKTQIKAARVFIPGLCPAKMTDNADFRQAVALGAKRILLSWKDEDLTRVETMLKTKPADVDVDGCYWHEPEDDGLDPAAFRATWNKQGTLMRQHGVRPTLVLMRFTLNANSGRNWRDYFPAGSVDVLCFDSYNLGSKKGVYSDAATQLDPIIAAAASVNLPWAIGETGAPILDGYTARDRVQWAANLRARGEAGKALYMLWWDQAGKNGGFDYRLDAETAAAFLE